MHGRKKVKAGEEQSAAEQSVEQAKILKYKQLTAAVLTLKQKNVCTPDALQATSKLLSVNPDFSTVWNYHRQIFLALFESTPPVEATDSELHLTEVALSKNPKSYSAWHHRMWVVKKFCTDLAHELVMCQRMLLADERNFHCWAYRRWVAKRSGRLRSEELEFTMEKISTNFSNYSAWHHRSALLAVDSDWANDGTERDVTKELIAELELVEQAVFTEPADQSPWIYHRWLLGQLAQAAAAQAADNEASNANAARIAERLHDHLNLLNDLAEEEPDCKWPVIAINSVQQSLQTVTSQAEMLIAVPHAASEQFKLLIAKDPDHKHFYEHELQMIHSACGT